MAVSGWARVTSGVVAITPCVKENVTMMARSGHSQIEIIDVRTITKGPFTLAHSAQVMFLFCWRLHRQATRLQGYFSTSSSGD